MNALTGVRGAVVRVTEKGEQIVSVAVPIQRFRAVLGVLLLSTQAAISTRSSHAERLGIMRVFGVATLVNVLLSLAAVLDNRQSAAAAFGCRHSRAPRFQGARGNP
jgi:two-component system sensor histidine kinase ChvG